MLVSLVVYNGELLHMLIGLFGSLYWGVIVYVELFCLVVYNGELLHMLSWSVWWSIMRNNCIC